MKIPKSVNVFGYNVPVKRIDLSERNLDGEYDFTEKVIFLDKSLRGNQLKQTYLHELGHAVSDRLGFNQVISADVEEFIVENIATCIVENL